MRILALGDQERLTEFQRKIGEKAEVILLDEAVEVGSYKPGPDDLVVDLNLDEHPENLKHYAKLSSVTVAGCAVKNQLAAMVAETGEEITCHLAGMNLLPGFINRSRAEVSFLNDKLTPVEEKLRQLGWEVNVVQDRVGMVTPRVIFMIINEACFTLQEGTAGKEDIDKGMKLGTNYPYGPFEWADMIGINHVYETLEAIYEDTHDERYKVCPLLKTHFFKGATFYA